MGCIEYMKNFYNDANFRIEAYAHILPPVTDMCTQMLTSTSQNTMIVNEILELYRFIVEKYAGHEQQ